jgi:hypothetical protein
LEALQAAIRRYNYCMPRQNAPCWLGDSYPPECFALRRKGDKVRSLGVIQLPDAYPIPDQRDLARLFVPYCKRVHAVKLRHRPLYRAKQAVLAQVTLEQVHYYLTISHCSKLVMLFQLFPYLFVVVYLAVVLEHEPAVAATKRLRAACASDYCKPGMTKSAASSDLLEMRLHHRDRVRFDNMAVCDKTRSVRPAVDHA